MYFEFFPCLNSFSLKVFPYFLTLKVKNPSLNVVNVAIAKIVMMML